MLVTRHREKLINAIIYFLGATKHVHTLKLFKLLNFADFEHFRQTGRTITGLDYRALPQGPVPTKLYEEIKRGGDSDLRSAIIIHAIKDDINDKNLRRDLKSKIAFDSKWFSKRELQIMGRVAEFFLELKAEDMSEFSHSKNMPWERVYQKGKGTSHLIPPEMALDSDPLIHDAPSISREELEYRRDSFRDTA
jgi:uncharacterized phage-associated protein